MPNGEDAGPIHPQFTERSGFRYCFTSKHHGHDVGAAQWLPELTHEEEFAIFDQADRHDLSDERQWLYGVRRTPDGRLLHLGTWNQQVSEYPLARQGELWHGYPLWPLKGVGPPNRQGEKHRPAREVFLRMEANGLLSAQQRKRLFKGKHV